MAQQIDWFADNGTIVQFTLRATDFEVVIAAFKP